jgi:FAD/FMN-containing dehydrogenase
MYGLASDSVVSMSVVLNNGEILPTVSAEVEPNLFWALRGGGSGSFAIILTFTIKIFKMQQNSMFRLTFPLTARPLLLWQQYFPHAEGALNSDFKFRKDKLELNGHFHGSMQDLDKHLQMSNLLTIPGVQVIKISCDALGSRLFMEGDMTCSNYSMFVQDHSKVKAYRKKVRYYLF